MRPSRLPWIPSVTLLLLALFAPAWTAPMDAERAIPDEVLDRAAALRDRVLESSQAWELLESLTMEVGPRLAGSSGDRAAVAWALAKLEAAGLSNVRAEPVEVPHWERGSTEVRITQPFPQTLVAEALGGSVGTPDEGIEAPVLRVRDLAALARLDPAQVEGTIVYFDRRMERTRTGQGYGKAVQERGRGPIEAARLGALAVAIRSAGTSSGRFAHTGATRYQDGVPRIPAVALSNADSDILDYQFRQGKPVRLRLRLTARHLPPARSANVIGEVPGVGAPDEVVLLAAHLDSWDVGTGAHDDGSGVAIAIEAARQIAGLEHGPRRTVRVVLYANEEFGLSGARAYASARADQIEKHVIGLESDLGAGRVWRFESRVPPAARPLVERMHRIVAPLGIELGGNEAGGGADLSPLRKAGMPVLGLRQDASAYFDYHHTHDDTLDKVDPEALRQNVAAYAAVAYIAASIEPDFGRLPRE